MNKEEKNRTLINMLNCYINETVLTNKQIEESEKFVGELLENISDTRCCTELKDKPKLNFGDWKFSQGLRYMSDFTYKNAKGELFDADVVNNTYNDYYNL